MFINQVFLLSLTSLQLVSAKCKTRGAPLWDALCVMQSYFVYIDVDMSCQAMQNIIFLSSNSLISLLLLFSCHRPYNSIKKVHSLVWPGQTRRPMIDR